MAVYHYTEESLRKHLLNLYDISCRAGGLESGIRLNPAGDEAAEYLFQEYQKAGLHNVRKQQFSVDRWWPERYSLAAKIDGEEKPLIAFPLWYTAGTEHTELELVDVGYGTSGEMRGKKIAGKAALLKMKRIFHFIQTFEKTEALEKLRKKGAAAVIVINVLHDVPSGMLAISHKDVMACQGKGVPLFDLPCLCIGKTDGLHLLDRLRANEVRVAIDLETSVAERKACNIIGELPGNDQSREVVVVGGHYDTWFGGALDNLASQGGIIELARHYASLPESARPRRLVFASIFGHEYGNQGHLALAEELRPIRDRITCFYDIDGSGSIGWEVDHQGRIVETGYNDVCGIVSSSNALSKLAYQALYSQDIFSIHYSDNAQIADLDGPMTELGIPTLLIISKHLFYHTPLDTPDRVPPDMVYRRMEVNGQIISNLLHSPPAYYIATNTNPFREEHAGIPKQPDLPVGELPANPRPWIDGPPRDLFMEIVPPTPRIFSPVLVWRGHSVSEGIARIADFSWSFGNLMEKILPKTRKGPATGTMYMIPGTKTIRMTVTDRYGRKSSVERKIRVTW
jgi:hypothetical protein